MNFIIGYVTDKAVDKGKEYYQANKEQIHKQIQEHREQISQIKDSGDVIVEVKDTVYDVEEHIEAMTGINFLDRPEDFEEPLSKP